MLHEKSAKPSPAYCVQPNDEPQYLSVRRRQLIELLEAAAEENRFDFVNDILVRYKNVKKIYGYKINSYWNNIADIDAYFKT